MIFRLLRRHVRSVTAQYAEPGSRPPTVGKPSVPDTTPCRARRCVQVENPAPRYSDPYAGVVTGPQLVERTRWTHAWHQKRYGDDKGWPEIEWGPFKEGDI